MSWLMLIDLPEGCLVGVDVGCNDGCWDGCDDGCRDGWRVGWRVGCDDGNIFAKITLLTKIPISSDGSDEIVMR
jgi:hypothetical protein